VAVNRDVGLRVGSRVSVLRLFRSPVSFEQLENRFGISREGLTDFMKLFRSSVTLEVVGITEPPPLGGAPQVYMGLDTLYTVTGGRVSSTRSRCTSGRASTTPRRWRRCTGMSSTRR
jgi:hypothetical protein